MSNHVCPKISDSRLISALASWQFLPEPDSAHEAWVRTLELLRNHGIAASEETQLIVDELAANAIVHAKTKFELSIELWEHGLRIIVSDLSKRKPVVRYPDPLQENGRGLFLLDHVAQDWGYHPTPTGKCIWARVPVASSIG